MLVEPEVLEKRRVNPRCGDRHSAESGRWWCTRTMRQPGRRRYFDAWLKVVMIAAAIVLVQLVSPAGGTDQATSCGEILSLVVLRCWWFE